MLRGTNLNAPIDGVRPDPQFSNVIEVVGRRRVDVRTCSASTRATSCSEQRGRRSSRRTTRSGPAETNSTGAFGLPASGDDCRPSGAQTTPRHRAGGSFSTQPIRNLGVSLNLRAPVRRAIQRDHRVRRQRRRPVQRSASRRRAQHAARDRAMGSRHASLVRDQLRADGRWRHWRRSDGRARRRRRRRADRRGWRSKLYRVDIFATVTNLNRETLHRLQRRDDVSEFRNCYQRAQSSEDRDWD